MTRYEKGFIKRATELKVADSLSDEELKQLAGYYNKNRDDRLDLPGDIARYLATGGSAPAAMIYHYNRSGGTGVLSADKSRTVRARSQKEVDRNNAIAKGVVAALGGVAGGLMGHGYSDRDVEQNTAIGASVGAGGAFLLMHLMQKLGQRRARKMLQKLKDSEQK